MARWSAEPQVGFQPRQMGPRQTQRSSRMCVWRGSRMFLMGPRVAHSWLRLPEALVRLCCQDKEGYTNEMCRPMPEVQTMVSLWMPACPDNIQEAPHPDTLGLQSLLVLDMIPGREISFQPPRQNIKASKQKQILVTEKKVKKSFFLVHSSLWIKGQSV